jgi:hypothetical protein
MSKKIKVIEHQDRDGCLARIIGEMRGEIEMLRKKLMEMEKKKKK